MAELYVVHTRKNEIEREFGATRTRGRTVMFLLLTSMMREKSTKALAGYYPHAQHGDGRM